jgi:hypothetical protein
VVTWLAENSAGGNRRLRAETDKVIYRPGQPIRVSARAYDERLEATGRYRLVARLRPGSTAASVPGSAPPPALEELELSPRAGEPVYEGALTTPPLRQVPGRSGDSLAPLRLLALDVLARDGDRVVAQTTLDVQVLDDPEEVQDPQSDPARLEGIAAASGGQVLHSAEDLARVLGKCAGAPSEVVVQKVPAWDHPALWLVLLGLLTAEWVLRRRRGLA